ncbi:MAG: Flp pilus assembly protein CpaB [Alphaproteobacteria bacterium]|nr:Flp pilus assembly protein CpaB [Alphaproteobacteria bacterium]
MRPIIIVLIVVALAISGLTVYLVRQLIQSSTDDQVVAQMPVSETRILVALQDMPAGTIVKAEDLEWRAWPPDGMNPEYVVQSGEGGDFGDFPGSAVRRGIAVGEPVTATKVFKRTEAGFLAGALSPGMRAVSVSVNDVSGASGFILPGDRIDVILTQRLTEFDPQAESSIERNVAQTILEDIRVLAVDQTINDVDETAKKAETVTLEVTASQAETVSLAAEMGKITISLRSLTKAVEEPLGPFQADFNVSRYLGRKVQTTNRVLVAARDLAQGTLLKGSDLDWRTFPARELHAGFYIEGAVDIQHLRGAYVMTAVKSGDVLLPEHLIFPDEDDFLYNSLTPGMRGYSILISQQSIVSGRISAGDFVDVILTTKFQDQGAKSLLSERRFSETVLQNVRLIAIDRAFDRESGGWKLGETATVEVSLKQAEILATAQSMGGLTLALRGSTPGDRLGTTPFTSDFEVSQAATAYVWGLTVPQPPTIQGAEEGEDDTPQATTSSQLAPIPAPTLAPASPTASQSSAGPLATGASTTVKVYWAGGATTYEFAE